MRRSGALVLLLLPAIAGAEDARPNKAKVNAAIDRGLVFLAKDALKWKEDHKCTSCHHASLVVCSMREAKRFGRAVDEPVLAEMTKWVAESGDGKFAQARTPNAPKAASPKAIYYALAIGFDSKPDVASQKGLKLLLKTVKSEQTENGSWTTWPGTRPPIFGNSNETLTALATLALLPAAAAGDKEAEVARDKGVKWLGETKTDDDPQSVALRLVLWKSVGRPTGEWEPLVKKIKDRQNADGGWSQTKDMASDAWATGQALYALARAGVKSDDAFVARGQSFLIKTQRVDGSWPMTSRPTATGGKGSTNLIPITGAGTAWAVLGLVRSAGLAEPAPPPDRGGK